MARAARRSAERGCARRLATATALALACCVASAPEALAQAALGRPAGAIPEANFDDLDAARERTAGQTSLGRSELPDSQPGLRTSTVSFTLQGIRFPVASTVYDLEQLEALYGERIGTDVTVAELREIADAIEALYRRDGYLATRVIIPPQTIADGVASLEIYEGRILFYEVNGEIGPVKTQIEALLDNLIVDEPARVDQLERYLLLARDLPGISLTGTLRSAGDNAPGGVVLVVDTARKATDAFVQAQNKNAEPTGPFSLAGGYAFNSRTERAERIGATLLSTHEIPEQITGYVIYEQSLGNDGLVLRAEHTTSFSEPGDVLAPLDLTAISSATSVLIEYPIIRSRAVSVWSRGGADVIDQNTDAGGTSLFDDQMRVGFLGLRGVLFDSLLGQVDFDLQGRIGLDAFGASGNSIGRSRTDATFDYRIIRGAASVTHPFSQFLSAFGGMEFQWSDRPLPTYEEMALGELSIGRGYQPGIITGDSGFALTGELRYAPPGIEIDWLDSVEVYSFVDYGRAYDFNRPTGEAFEDLMSVGGGVRFQILETMIGDVYLAVPRTEALSTSARLPKATVKFSLTKFF